MKKHVLKVAREFVYTLTHNGECVARCHSLSDAFVEASCFKSGQFEIQRCEAEDGYILIPSDGQRIISFEVRTNTINFPM